jgi:hypothetical protein
MSAPYEGRKIKKDKAGGFQDRASGAGSNSVVLRAFFPPMFKHRIGGPGKPPDIALQRLNRNQSEKFDSVVGRLAERLEQSIRHEVRDIMDGKSHW